MKSMITIAVVLLIGASWVQAQGRGVRGGGRQGARLQAALRTSSTDAVQRPIRQRLRDPNNYPLLTNQASQPTQRGMRLVPRCGGLFCGQGLGTGWCLWGATDSTTAQATVVCPRCGRLAPGGGRHGGWRTWN